MKAAQTNTTNEVTITGEDVIAFQDFKNSLLIVLLFVNVFIFTAWLTLQVTDQYNAAITRVLLG